MSKSRSFSIFLLKEGFSSENALKPEHKLGEPIEASNLPENSVLYLLDSSPHPPWWKNYWGIDNALNQVLKGSIVFIPSGGRLFALTFGHTYHNLKENSYEYDFGIRVTLNSLNPKKLKSTDILNPDSAKRLRMQSPTESDLTFFDFDRDSSIMKRLTGIVKDEYKGIFTNATGASNLRISSKVQPEGIIELLEELLEIYSKEDFKESFPDLQNITPVNDPVIVDSLDAKLLQAFNETVVELVLTIPEIVDYQDALKIYFSGAGGRDIIVYQDVYIGYYRKYLESNSKNSISIKDLKKHKLNLCNDDGISYKNFSIYKSMLFDSESDGLHYHFCDGNWYLIETEYIEKLKNFLDPYFYNEELLFEYNHNSEGDYNQKMEDGNSKFICLDKTNISPNGQYQVEPCDLYYVDNTIASLYHVKISTRSSTLSHLFNQGLNSLELLRVEPESKAKLNDLIKERINGNNEQEYLYPVENDNYKVVYAIITHKDKEKKSQNLPIFSRISLKRSLTSYKLMGVDTGVCFINDISPKKEGEKKKKIELKT